MAPQVKPNLKFGMTLSSEEHPPRRLVELGRMAEEAGFDFVSVSDHFHPWVDAQGHSPFVWSVLGALAEATDHIGVGVGVTCPTVRIHPAILAQATATTSHLLGDRFVWGVGTGEALNEHILAARWPPFDVRIEMLEEAVELVRTLWEGESVTHRGTYYTVEDARIYDAPQHAVPIVVSAFGPNAAEVAARIGDGLWTSGANRKVIDAWKDAGGTGPVYSQLTMCWGEDAVKALDTAHKLWPNTAVPGQLAQDLPTPLHFEQAAEAVTRERLAADVPHGPDPEPMVEEAVAMVDAGVDHLYFHQVGPDQEGFVQFWQDELRPALEKALD